MTVQLLIQLGGFQKYCCTGFTPSSKAIVGGGGNGGSLIGTPGLGNAITAAQLNALALQALAAVQLACLSPLEYGVLGTVGAGALIGSAFGPIGTFIGAVTAAAAGVIGLLASLSCQASTQVAAAVTALGAVATLLQSTGNPSGGTTTTPPTSGGNGIGSGSGNDIGQWARVTYPSTSGPDCTCSLSYTCRYGLGFDEVIGFLLSLL
jgi:chitinase